MTADPGLWFGVLRKAYEGKYPANLRDPSPLITIDFVARPMPDDFMPEMTTRYDPITDSDLRLGRYRDGDMVIELNYVLSRRDLLDEWREKQPKRDAELRVAIWNGMEAAQLMESSEAARLALETVGLVSGGSDG